MVVQFIFFFFVVVQYIGVATQKMRESRKMEELLIFVLDSINSILKASVEIYFYHEGYISIVLLHKSN